MPVVPLPSVTFPFAANMEQPIIQRYGYRTDIIPARDGSEQRIQLRITPRGKFSFRAETLDPLEAELANSILFASQDQAIGVPLWQYMEPLIADTGSPNPLNVVQVITTNVPFEAGGMGIVWTSPTKFQSFTILSKSASVLVIDPPLSQTFFAKGSWVMPLVSARFSPEQPFNWRSLTIGGASLDFIVERYPQMPSSTTFRQWQTVDLLEEPLYEPNRNGDVDEEYKRSFALLDNTTGVMRSETMALSPNPSRTLKWSCFTRAEAKTLFDFLDARRGMAVPFWFPSWQRDLTLAVDAAGGSATILVPGSIGYRLKVFPMGKSRRYIHLRNRINPISSFPYYTFVTSVTASGGNDRLFLAPPTNRDYQIVNTLISYLNIYRFATDEVELIWRSRNVVECEIPVVEVPREAP